jgi:hypothetical protein
MPGRPNTWKVEGYTGSFSCHAGNLTRAVCHIPICSMPLFKKLFGISQKALLVSKLIDFGDSFLRAAFHGSKSQVLV